MDIVVSEIKKLCSFEAKTLPFSSINPSLYGQKAWANDVLREAIRELNNVDRVLSARSLEVFYFLGELERHGFKWQVTRLRNHINLAIKKGRFTISKEINPIEEMGGSSSC
jgi:hypothetical protein